MHQGNVLVHVGPNCNQAGCEMESSRSASGGIRRTHVCSRLLGVESKRPLGSTPPDDGPGDPGVEPKHPGGRRPAHAWAKTRGPGASL